MKLLSLITEKPIAYYAIVKRIVGSTTAAIFLQQALYWWDKKHEEWLEKTVAEFEEETALTRWEQESSIKLLTAKGYLKHEKKGMPPKRRFYLNVDAIENSLQIYVKGKESNTRQDHGTYSGKTSKRIVAKPRNVTRQDHDSIYKESENTTENTTESVVFPLSGEPRAKVLEILGSESELIRFEDYWTEPNAKGKQLWQFKPTFDVFRRARTWAERAAKDRAKNAPRGVANPNAMDRPRYVSGLPGAFTFPQIREMLESGKIRTESDYEGKITYVLNSHAPQA